MKTLTALDHNAVILVSREGGIAFMPKLNGARRIEAAQMSDDKRANVCELINHMLSCASTTQAQAGSGDQRYYRLCINSGELCRDLELIVPETAAPQALVNLWKDAGQ
ncbi:protealysin inhibitor emfourin [Pseudomonas sp.]|uniref:protealysin inhibitor emfourin n=1 Tax=Pseudomonas sp. TaxID=306 RepID=UPI002614F948|nr:protealysin inhibitor emfourin [Pseudomonas sp.]